MLTPAPAQADLSVDAGTLAAGTTITPTGVSRQGDIAWLHVTVSRAETATTINETTSIRVMSVTQTLATLGIPVDRLDRQRSGRLRPRRP